MDDPRNIRFGSFVLNRAHGCLEDATGAERFLRPKSYRVLELLCDRCGQLVSKDELIRETWPDVFVSDDSLAQCVSDIRRALGPEGASLLRTVPRRGYVLVDQGAHAQGPGRAHSKQWIVRTGGLIAVSFVAITVLWVQPHNRSEVESFATDPAMQQVDALLEARDWQQRENNEQARLLLESVVSENPEHADALASLGLTYWLEVQHVAWGGGRREMERALELVERAVAIGGSARSHRLLAEMRLLSPFPEIRSPIDALANARAAVTIDAEDPDNLAVLAQALALTGRSHEAMRIIEEALRRDPTPPDWYRQVAGLSYLLAGEPVRAVEQFGPLYGAGTFTQARWWPGWLFAASLAHAGRTEEAARVVSTAQRHRPTQSVAGVAESFDGFANDEDLEIFLEGLKIAGVPG
ncbi:MAG: winged helix-turn-helix domain-containing protein [Pseudomonadota bacterium]